MSAHFIPLDIAAFIQCWTLIFNFNIVSEPQTALQIETIISHPNLLWGTTIKYPTKLSFDIGQQKKKNPLKGVPASSVNADGISSNKVWLLWTQGSQSCHPPQIPTVFSTKMHHHDITIFLNPKTSKTL